MTDSHDQLPDPECAPLIKKPAGGTPPLVTTVQGILEWCARVKADEDLAIDVERASSYRYSAKAYLVQIKTEAAGILLLDPLACQLPG
ncbi:MAG: ribonuclease D, partial [Dermabacter sp.]|nr:ribonuclease D [Dermabacter sp.]